MGNTPTLNSQGYEIWLGNYAAAFTYTFIILLFHSKIMLQ